MSQAESIPITDPIFTVIEARRQTRDLWDAATRRLDYYEGNNRTPTGGLANDATSAALEVESLTAGDADRDAVKALFTTEPTTVAGMIALLEYVTEAENEIDQILTLRDHAGDPGHHVLFSTLISALKPLAA
jgi:hypothetical protein